MSGFSLKNCFGGMVTPMLKQFIDGGQLAEKRYSLEEVSSDW